MSDRLQLTDSNDPVREEDLQELELLIGYQLPLDFKQFLRKYNGGRPSLLYAFPIYANRSGDLGLLNGFNCLTAKPYRRVYDDIRYQLGVFKNRMPHHLIPFAFDPGGNQLCISARAKDYGKIYFWDHEEEEEYEDDDGTADAYPGIYLVAQSFTAFLESLTEYS